MFQTLTMNLFVILLAAVALVQTGNPMVLFILFFMHDLPVHVLTNEQQIRASKMEKDDEDDDEPAIGFTAKV